jgi:tetratricopeptide (TPR) repeat protein
MLRTHFMTEKLNDICNRTIEAGWLLALIVTPLWFNVFSYNSFELNKVTAVRSIALIMLLVWAIKGLGAWRNPFTHRRRQHIADASGVRIPISETDTPTNDANLSDRKTGYAMLPHRISANPLPFLALFWLMVYGFASTTSVAPHLSLWGSYHRLEGLYTTGSYLIIFFSICVLMRTWRQFERLITAVLLVSFPVALYGILQHIGLDPVDWNKDVSTRVSSTLGNPIFLAGFLAMTIPFTLYRLLTARNRTGRQQQLLIAGYLVLLAVQLSSIFFTRSRGPLIGLIAGVFVFVIILSAVRQKKDWTRFIVAVGIVVVLAGGLLIIPHSKTEFIRNLPYLDRMSQAFEGSGRVRLLIWRGAVQLILAEPKRTLIGYGPESMFVSFPPYYDPELRRLEGKTSFPDRSHNETFDTLITTGLLGGTIYLLFIIGLMYYGIKGLGLVRSTGQIRLFLLLCSGGGIGALVLAYIIDRSWLFSGIALPFGILIGIIIYLAGLGLSPARGREPDSTSQTNDLPPQHTLLVACFISAIVIHFVEIQFGIATASTRVLFWSSAGVISAVLYKLYYYSSAKNISGHRRYINPVEDSGTVKDYAKTDLPDHDIPLTAVSRSLRINFISGVAWRAVAIGFLSIGVVYVIITTNVNVVRADIYFKQAHSGFHEKGLYDKAIAYYYRAIDLQPSQDFYYLFLSKAQTEKAISETNPQEQADRFREAETTLAKAIDINPLEVDHKANMARLYSIRARYTNDPGDRSEYLQKAFLWYEQSVARNPGNILLWNEFGEINLQSGNISDAYEIFAYSLELDSQFSPTYLILGDLYMSQAQWSEAAWAYEQAVTYNDTSTTGRSKLGYIYAHLGRFEDAIQENNRVLDLKPDDHITHTNLAILHQYLGNTQTALLHSQTALRNAPQTDQPVLEHFISQLRNRSNGYTDEKINTPEN